MTSLRISQGTFLLVSLLTACREQATGAAPPSTQSPTLPSASAPAASVRPQSPPTSQPVVEAAPPPPAEVIVYDPTTHAPDPNVRSLVGRDKLPKGEQKRILDLVFGAGRYLTDAKSCRGTATDLDAARRGGDFVPSVSEVATGSFTSPNAKQALYLVTNGECGATHADNWGTITLAVLDKNAVVARTNMAGGASLHGVFDLDGDGQSEVLFTSGFTNQGATTEGATLRRLDNGKLVEVKSFGEVYSSNCAGPFDPKKEEYTVIRAVVRPGAAPEFRTEKKSRPCE